MLPTKLAILYLYYNVHFYIGKSASVYVVYGCTQKSLYQLIFHFHIAEIEISTVEGKGVFEMFKSIFNINNFLNAWRTLLKKRDGHKRLYIILLILAFELEIFLR